MLGLITSMRLMDRLPESQEGVLTQTRQASVNNKHLTVVAERLGLHGYLRIGKGLLEQQKAAGAAKAGADTVRLSSILLHSNFSPFNSILLHDALFSLELSGGVDPGRHLHRLGAG